MTIPENPQPRDRFNKYNPVEADIDHLDRDLVAFLSQPAVSPRTQMDYAKLWRRWIAFCGERALTPLPAPYAAFEALLGAASTGGLRRRGTGPMSVVALECFLAAVRHHHHSAGFEVAYQEPAHAAAFAAARHAYRKHHGRSITKAQPLTPEMCKRLLAASRPLTRPQCVMKAVLLTLLDSGRLISDLAKVAPEHVEQLGQDVTLRVPEGEPIHLSCDHRERILGVPHECAACAVITLHGVTLPGTTSLFDPRGRPAVGVSKEAKRSAAYGLAASFGGLSLSGWTAVERTGGRSLNARLIVITTDALLLEGARRGLVLGTQRGALSMLRAKAVLAASFVLGMSGGNGLGLIKRADVRPHERGFLISMPPARRDGGCSSDVMWLPPSLDLALCPVRWLSEWLMVRDAALGANDAQSLLCKVQSGCVVRPELALAVPFASFRVDLLKLQKIAGLAGLTPHSTRAGYSITAEAQGVSLLARQATMRLKKPETAAAYSVKIANRRAISELIDKLDKPS